VSSHLHLLAGSASSRLSTICRARSWVISFLLLLASYRSDAQSELTDLPTLCGPHISTTPLPSHAPTSPSSPAVPNPVHLPFPSLPSSSNSCTPKRDTGAVSRRYRSMSCSTSYCASGSSMRDSTVGRGVKRRFSVVLMPAASASF
jgi:hypothetical protein